MKAAVLTAFGTQLAIEDLPDPIARSGEVLVDVVAAPVAPYAREVFSGERHHALETPIVPGCGAIGRVRAVRGDATRLAAGDWVLCDPTVRARDDARTPDITLQGWSARGDGGLRLQRTFHDGPFAERMLVPTENAVALARSTPRMPAAGVRSICCSYHTGGCSRSDCRPARRSSSAARPATTVAVPSRSRLPWAPAASSRRAATPRFSRSSCDVSARACAPSRSRETRPRIRIA